MRLAVAAAGVVLLGGIPRVLLAAGTLPDALRAFVWSDALFTYLRGLAGHRLPYIDGPFEYPPILGYLAGLFSVIANDATAYLVLWTVLLAACAGASAFVLARMAPAARVAGRFVLMPELLLFGTLNFDLVPVVMLVTALAASRAGRQLTGAILLALGTASKLFPAVVLPAVASRSRRPWMTFVLFAVVLVAITLPMLFASTSPIEGLRYYAGIGSNIDSPWGLLSRLLDTLNVPFADTLVLVVTVIGLGATLLVVLRARTDPSVASGLAIVAVLFWTRRYSPQYSLWILPTLVLTPISGRVVALLAVADTLVFLTISPLTLIPRDRVSSGDLALLGLLAAAIVLRHVALFRVGRSLWSLAARHRDGELAAPSGG